MPLNRGFLPGYAAAAGTPGDTGLVLAGTGSNVNDGASQAWINTGNITADDASNASTNMFSVGAVSQRLVASNFDFSGVPAGATITSIEVRIQTIQQNDNGDVIIDHTVQLSKDAGSTLFGTNQALGTQIAATVTDRDYTFTANMPTAAEVKNSNFSVVFKVNKSSGASTTNNTRVDVVWMKVNYTS